MPQQVAYRKTTREVRVKTLAKRGVKVADIAAAEEIEVKDVQRILGIDEDSRLEALVSASNNLATRLESLEKHVYDMETRMVTR